MANMLSVNVIVIILKVKQLNLSNILSICLYVKYLNTAL